MPTGLPSEFDPPTIPVDAAQGLEMTPLKGFKLCILHMHMPQAGEDDAGT